MIKSFDCSIVQIKIFSHGDNIKLFDEEILISNEFIDETERGKPVVLSAVVWK